MDKLDVQGTINGGGKEVKISLPPPEEANIAMLNLTRHSLFDFTNFFFNQRFSQIGNHFPSNLLK